VSLDFLKEKGIPLDEQKFDWRDIVGLPTSKLDDDALTRVRTILMNGIQSEALRFQHACARMNKELQLALARVRRTVSAGKGDSIRDLPSYIGFLDDMGLLVREGDLV
jgi:hypothetical protein